MHSEDGRPPSGIPPFVGVVLMVAITVVLAAIVALVAFGIIGGSSQAIGVSALNTSENLTQVTNLTQAMNITCDNGTPIAITYNMCCECLPC